MGQDLAGKRVLVMGLGRFGGGLGVTRWLVGQGAEVVLTDLLAEDELAEQLAPLRGDIDAGRVRLRLGQHDEADFRSANLVVASPAVPKPWRNPFIRAAEHAGVPLTTEIGLLYERIPDGARVVGVTGSAGKSTTSAMIAAGARAAFEPDRRVFYGGNIGGSLLGDLPQMTDESIVVLELSSAMLWWLSRGVWSRPGSRRGVDVAVVTNFAPNHLDWHGSLEDYQESKQALLRRQPMDAAAVFGPRMGWEANESVREFRVQPEDARGRRLTLPGRHNATNAAMAAAACRALGAAAETAWAAVASFPGLPHRLQFVGEFAGVRFYNDSKSTTPEAAVLAMDALADAGVHRVHLIAGGYDKGLDLTPMVDRVGRAGPGVLYAVGATGDVLVGLARRRGVEAVRCGTVQGAAEEAWALAEPGDAVLLSPGCASWDQFTNYEERGDLFVRTARSLAEKVRP